MGHLSQFEADPFAARRVLPSYRLSPDLVADDKTSPCFHASFRVIVELVLPRVDLGRADVEAWFLFTAWAYLRVDRDEGFRVLAETY